jgi:hypothetical protein
LSDESLIALCVYRCEVAGERSDKLDFQVRLFTSKSDSEVRSFLLGEPTHRYDNDLGEQVAWPLVGILDIQPLVEAQQGSEIAGFIAGGPEIAGWVDPGEVEAPCR